MGEGCKILDLRSDTSSPPTEEMLEAIKKAEVGNDAFDEDPNINKLENSGAELFKMEKALFVPAEFRVIFWHCSATLPPVNT